MTDPVIAPEGQSFDRAALAGLVENPITRTPLNPADLRANLAMQAALEHYLDNGAIDKTAPPYQCAISGAQMTDPVVLPDGRSCQLGQEPRGARVYPRHSKQYLILKFF